MLVISPLDSSRCWVTTIAVISPVKSTVIQTSGESAFSFFHCTIGFKSCPVVRLSGSLTEVFLSPTILRNCWVLVSWQKKVPCYQLLSHLISSHLIQAVDGSSLIVLTLVWDFTVISKIAWTRWARLLQLSCPTLFVSSNPFRSEYL